jgi:4-amino-4-deoxy-L-arabinose transferase-like glycosyltransferase
MGEQQQSIYTRTPAKIGAIIAVAGLLYLLGNGRVSLWDRDEPRYAMASRWMAMHGDWVVPRIGWGENPQAPRTAKPILIYWLQAAAMKLFGPTAEAARLPSALAMIGTLIIVAAAVYRFAGERRALWTTFILASSAMVIVAAKMCVTDSVLLLWMVVAQGCLFGIYNKRDAVLRTGRYAILFWIAVGLGGLTKGPVALGIPLTTIIVLGVLDRRMRWWKRTRPIFGLLIVAAIVAPWLAMVHYRAPGVLHQMIFHDVVERVQTGLEGHKAPPGFYLVTIFGTFFPWSLMLPMALGIAWKNRDRAEIRFALAAVIGPWIMMEIVQTKLVHYLLPIFPPLAFLVADAVVQCFEGRYQDLKTKAAFVGGIVWGLVMIALCSLPWFAARKFEQLPWGSMLLISVIGIVSAGGVAILSYRRRPAGAMLTMGVGFFALIAVLFGMYLPRADFLRLSARVAPLLPNDPNVTVRMMGYREQSLAFYQGGTIAESAEEVLKKASEKNWPRYVVLTRTIFDALPAEKQAHLQILGEFEGINYAKSTQRLNVIVARTQ